MQPIIVAVDFSNTSIHAVEYAVSMAGKMKSDILLVWVDKLNPQESVYPDTSNENRQEARKRFDEMIAQFGPKLGKGVTMEYRLKKGRIHHEVDALARQVSAELVVAGAHGISGYEEYWIGSNAYKIVSCSACPVITLRHDFPVRKSMDRIVVPIDSSGDTLQKVTFVVKLAGLFKSEIHLVTTHTSHLKSIQRLAEKVTQQARTYIQQHNLKVVEDTIVSNDITKAIITYAVNVDADLLSIMTEQETPMNMLLGAQAQQLINQSPIPVLSIHPLEKFNLA